jgi:hypothetical protein
MDLPELIVSHRSRLPTSHKKPEARNAFRELLWRCLPRRRCRSLFRVRSLIACRHDGLHLLPRRHKGNARHVAHLAFFSVGHYDASVIEKQSSRAVEFHPRLFVGRHRRNQV